jgi:hypothetical protein
MQVSAQDLIDFDYCPWYHSVGGVQDSDFNKIIRPAVNATLLRYWAYRIQAGVPHSADIVFLARSIFAQMLIEPPEDIEKYLRRMIGKSDHMVYDKIILVGAELSAKLSKEVTVRVDVPVLFDRRGIITAVYYSFTPETALRKAPAFKTAAHGFIPNLLFLHDDIRIDRVVLPYYQGTVVLRRAETHVNNARTRFEFLATGISRKISYHRYGPWCETCPLHINGKCNILRD